MGCFPIGRSSRPAEMAVQYVAEFASQLVLLASAESSRARSPLAEGQGGEVPLSYGFRAASFPHTSQTSDSAQTGHAPMHILAGGMVNQAPITYHISSLESERLRQTSASSCLCVLRPACTLHQGLCQFALSLPSTAHPQLPLKSHKIIQLPRSIFPSIVAANLRESLSPDHQPRQPRHNV